MAQIEAVDRTLLSRYEIKYIVPPERLLAMRRFLAPFVKPDPYAALHPGFTYPLCSLYLDSNALVLCNMTMQGIKNRFKLRVRTYSDDPRMPVYCEIKRRVDGAIVKRRARMGREGVPALLQGRLPRGEGIEPAALPTLEEFHALIHATRAAPVIRVRYLREAYESATGDPFRVTFDTMIEHALTAGPELSLNGGEWKSTPTNGVILEVKFTNLFPSWLPDLVRTFQLQRQSVAKYVLSICASADRRAGVPAMRLRRSRAWIDVG